ncbi:MAG: outer membrane protein assembly factor BamE [Sulfuricella sp.]|nr:outer membrane protein assembly factor BamE [Sulfuricella sp.]
MKPVLRMLVVLPILFVAACSVTDTVVEKITPYKIDIPQGNIVTQEMVAKLKPGMTKSQVRFIMGTPLITDVFHANRWDYVYRNQRAGKLIEERKLTLFFEQEALARVEGDVVAASPGEEKKAAVEPPAPATEATAKAAEDVPAKEEKGFFGKMLEKVGL